MYRIFLIALLTSIVTGSSVRATPITYQYVTDAVANGGTISGTQGQEIAINIYLQETLPPSTSSLIANSNGLFGFAVVLSQSGGSGTTQIVAGDGSVNSSLFPDSAPLIPSSGLTSSQSFLAFNSILATSGAVPDASGKILLTTAYLNVGSGVTSFSILPSGKSDPYGPGNTLLWDQTTDLDVNNQTLGFQGAGSNIFTFNVDGGIALVVTPEPSSWILFGMIALGFAAPAVSRRLFGPTSMI